MEGDCAFECSIARYAKFREWSVWLQRHKVGNARSCTSFLPSRLEEGEVCAKILFTDDERCRVCVNPTICSPPDCATCHIARAIEAEYGVGRSLRAIVVVLIDHFATEPSSDAASLCRLLRDTIDTCRSVSVRVSQTDE